MKKRKRAFFAFQPGDCEAAQLWLTELYDQGWELSRLYWFAFLPAKFVPRTRDDLKYCVDEVSYNGKSQVCPDDYDRMIEDSGWELFDCCNSLNVYKSKPGTDPAPIHTDPALAKGRFLRLTLLPNLLCALVLLVFAFFFLYVIFFRAPVDPLAFLASGWDLLYLALALLSIPWVVLCAVRALLRYRRLARGEFPSSSIRQARLFSYYFLSLYLLSLFLIFVPVLRSAMSDGWVSSSDYPVLLSEYGTAHTVRHASPFLEALSTEQPFRAGDLTQTRYDCRFDWVADLAVSTRLSRARAGGLTPAPADLGFDESWTADDYLLLREGDVVAELSGLPDLTEPEMLGRIRTSLELG